MKFNIFKHVTVLLVLSVSFSSCDFGSRPGVKEVSLCEPPYSIPPFPPHPTIANGIAKWVYDVIDERLENGTHGTITQCEYIDGIGYLFEPLGNSI